MMMNSNSPIAEHKKEGRDFDDYDYEESETVSGGGCGCFRFCFDGRGGGDRWRLVQRQQELNGLEQRENWLNENLNKLKEASEIVAGPKWKNFIRKIGKYWKNENRKERTVPLQYDAEGYALNFDRGEEDEEEERLMVGFTSRFAPPFSGELNKERTGL